MYELLGAGIANIVQLKYLIPLTIGTLVGVIGGELPGRDDHDDHHRGVKSPSGSIRSRAWRR